MMLGRLPHNPDKLAASPRHVFGAMPAPARVDRRYLEFTPGLFGNDLYPNCTFVALTNAMCGVAKTHKFTLAVDENDPVNEYDIFLGKPPDLALTEGAEMLDVLNWQIEHGLTAAENNYVGVPVTIDHTDRQTLARAIFQFGHGYWGVTLRERDMENPAVWDVVDGRDDGAIVGGHAINAWDYTGLADENTVRVGTWGAWMPATWNWIEARLEEAHCLTWNQLAGAPISGAPVSNTPPV